MKRFLARFALVMLAVSAAGQGGVPGFRSFDTNYFNTDNRAVTLRSNFVFLATNDTGGGFSLETYPTLVSLSTNNGLGLTNIQSTNIIGLTDIGLSTNAAMIWVDPVNGNDTTGRRGRFDKPFKTIITYDGDEETTNGALSVAIAGDTVVLLAGNYTNVGSIVLLENMTLLGSGRGSTRIWNDNGSQSYGPAITLADNAVVANLSVQDRPTSDTFRNPIGLNYSTTFGTPGTIPVASPRSATNFAVLDCDFFGQSDAVYFDHTNTFFGSFYNCTFQSDWDGVLFSSRGNSNSWLDFHNCTMDLQSRATISHNYNAGLLVDQGRVRWFGGSIKVKDGPTATYGVWNRTANSTSILSGVVISTISTNGAVLDITNASGGRVEIVGSRMEKDKVDGTLLGYAVSGTNLHSFGYNVLTDGAYVGNWIDFVGGNRIVPSVSTFSILGPGGVEVFDANGSWVRLLTNRLSLSFTDNDIWELIWTAQATGDGKGITNLGPQSLNATNSGTVGQVPKRINATDWYWANDDNSGVGGGGVTNLADLNDVELTALADNQGLLYDSVLEKWVNAHLSFNDITNISLNLGSLANGQVLTFEDGIWTNLESTGGETNLADLFDVDLNSPQSSDILTYNGTKWVNSQPVDLGLNLDDLNDVDTGSPSTGEALVWNGSIWTNGIASVGTQVKTQYSSFSLYVTNSVGTNFMQIALALLCDTPSDSGWFLYDQDGDDDFDFTELVGHVNAGSPPDKLRFNWRSPLMLPGSKYCFTTNEAYTQWQAIEDTIVTEFNLVGSAPGGGSGGFTNMMTSTITYGTTITPDLDITGLVQYSTTPRRITFRLLMDGGDVTTVNAPTGTAVDGDTMIWEVIQDGTGSRLISGWNAVYAFGDDITGITLSTTASKRDFISWQYNSTAAKWFCVGFVRGY